MRKKGTIYTLISCRMDISSRKYSRIHYSWCPTAFISLLISIMKMLYHLSDKNHLFQELKPWRPCGTTLVLWFTNHSFLYRKWYFSLDRPLVRNHLTVETRSVRRTDVTISSPHLLISDSVSKEKPEEKCEKPPLGWTTSEWPAKKW